MLPRLQKGAIVNPIISLLKRSKGSVFVNEDGLEDCLEFVAA
jgi:hypothetical protein